MSNKLNPINVAILGATGRVGQELVSILDERDFPVGRFVPIASARSAKSKIRFKGDDYEVVEVGPDAFKGIDLVLASAGASVSKQWAQTIIDCGAVIIDNSSAFRMDPAVPLVVPEVNGEALRYHKGIIANPNCSTSQLVVVLKVLHDLAELKRVIVSTYQSVSGAGKEAMDELEHQSRTVLDGNEAHARVMPRQIAFNLIPHIDSFCDDGYTKEEVKVINETRKILDLPDLPITCTAVRVPVSIGHSESVTVDLGRSVSLAQVRESLSDCPIVEIWDQPESLRYPTPIDCVGQDPVYVGRIRRDTSSPNGINLWVVADNLRIGAALNAVRIAEYMLAHDLLKQPVIS
ncbi:MAG: aspartate-semialdehyde dehydrogenase [Candidatus Obscuribacterales bacterium]|nr:aspartate-semialdehyde dehydrogenase [Candidatus Obscuribacterales bacterium]